MAIRIYDPSILKAQGALLDLSALIRQRKMVFAYEIKQPRSLLLRWQTSPAAGLPSEPFKVWRRPAQALGEQYAVQYEVISLGSLGFNAQIIQFDAPLASVSLNVFSRKGGNVSIAVLCGVPSFESIVTTQSRTLAAGETVNLEFQAPLITSLLLLNVSRFSDVVGMYIADLDKIQDWELVETVGLPVDEGEWAPLGQQHGIKQGLVGAEVPAVDAAIDRFKRGVNPAGWWPSLPDGTVAPVWELPDADKLIEESAIELLPMLRQVAQHAPDKQAAEIFTFKIAPPQNPAGEAMPTDQPSQANLSPVGLLAMLASGDPLLAVALGYGTGYPEEDRSYEYSASSQSAWDWMITGLWKNGLDGKSGTVEFAAIVPRPGLAIPAPTPADLKVDFQAHLRPALMDDPWLASVRSSWERFPTAQLTSVASFAAARHAVGSAGNAEVLLERRMLTQGHRPIINTRNLLDPEPTRQSATDGTLRIPNSPGRVSMHYAIATQNIFGIWSSWREEPIEIRQPAPAIVQILSADLHATDPGTGTACPATLVFEISVDWKVRSIKQIDFRSSLFAAASRFAEAPGTSTPIGIQKQLGGTSVTASITFDGDIPAMDGGKVEALNPEGTAVVAPGPEQSSNRRYRVSITDFSLDYAATPHIGLRLRSRLVERIPPYRKGAWSPVAKLAYASDPRARPTTVIDIVRLTSLPDAAGECHAHLDWNPIPGAIGYAIYESTETRILSSHPGYPEPSPARTLSQRLTTIKQAFSAAPLRRDFTRRNAKLVTDTDLDVTLPRGSRDIHLYTILPVMAGGNEGPWPSGPGADKALIPYAAPRVAEPAPPTIEVQLVQDQAPAAPNYRARLLIGTRADSGARPTRIDIYRVRVDDAARRLDSMGAPIASLSATNASWKVSPPLTGGDWIDSVSGHDQPAGSWRTVWYRAVAWSADDPLRAVLKGRSQPSPAVSVLIPPAHAPDLSPLTISSPGGDPAWVLLSFSSSAPVSPTPIGPHTLSISANVQGGVAMVEKTVRLDEVATAQPVTGSDVWRVDGTSSSYSVLLRRAALSDSVSVIVRITDPLGRISEQSITVGAGSVLPLPSLSVIDAFFITGRGHVYSFATNAPDTDGVTGIYRLYIALTADSSSPFPFPRPRGGRNPVDGTSPARTLGQFSLVKGLYVFNGALSSVPKVNKALPSSNEALALYRQTLPTDDNFVIFSRIALRSVLVRITTPDGRIVERRWKA
ncbi:hypothetical protein LG201_10220 [Methylobacillus gramineus]|uniref:hypothetical protein n=1 Tax=Methylobacillus gramineus TaxID=755169 RepID=UPI001CFFEBA9|nr:hypothetical protein [Methylobacillus gramineus]MCB5185577.1 hypothetical protein [Methylobacillus gramineus]